MQLVRPGDVVTLTTYLNLPSHVQGFPVEAAGVVLSVNDDGTEACVKYTTQQGTMSTWMSVDRLTVTGSHTFTPLSKRC